MDKAEVIERYHALVKELDEPSHKVVLSAGAAMVMLGLRKETHDLDVDVTEEVFNWQKSKKPVKKFGGKEFVVYDKHVDLHAADFDLIGVQCVEGVWIYSVNSLLIQKRYLSNFPQRPVVKMMQDLADINALEGIVYERDRVLKTAALDAAFS